MAAYYGNRSFAYLKTECYGYALSDASKALELDNKYIKVSESVINPLLAILLTLCVQGYYRRASANMAVGKFKQALKDFEAVIRVRPRDKDAMSKYTECSKVVRQIAFEKAIAVESSHKKPSEIIDLDTIGEYSPHCYAP